MSKHVTILLVDVDPVLKSLPPRSHVHSVKLSKDRKSIEIIWENDASKTGRTYPVPYPLERLEELSPKVVNHKQKLVAPTLWPFKKVLTSET